MGFRVTTLSPLGNVVVSLRKLPTVPDEQPVFGHRTAPLPLQAMHQMSSYGLRHFPELDRASTSEEADSAEETMPVVLASPSGAKGANSQPTLL